ncbi:MAG: DUF4393 domain-containing protein [Lachnospiraceae bacterium]|nr:DUF4393 domain-containing protein [Lachnospiraceae bacterium]MDE7240179.1 DUF4393 domain-containing protein [Lachnospiraceae bacterium]
MDENSKNIKLEIAPSINDALKNLTDKPTQNIGNTLSDIWYLVFSSVSYRAEKKKIKYEFLLDQYRKELEDSISNIPREKRVDPSLQITAQALENSKYCIEEKELRKMFASLICNSMNTDYSSYIHPSFAEIIKQMSVLDARILQLIKKSKIGLPICQYLINVFGDLGNTTLPDHIFLELPDVDFQLCSQSLSSLSRLGIVSISYSNVLTGAPNLYDKFLEHPLYKDLSQQSPFKTDIRKGVVTLTPLGRSFAKVCIDD